ncbi:MAG: bifunctional diaminohydroxyphosphoribosylaminopyrimidine deaminase/5-amino-6-(5-phosphoribosylamino)uracil reductase RibD, partial [Gammaproteobacteria bacterium]|nr:bifunctional diaminohydroxyphosphoribosylaminopyrimidine deaminase/5-amino-6-(5-phosphoribosylamino)uracil reductase RibD [Gammaproteobacteria bacterium]
ALKSAGPHAEGSIAYVTLEPCCHFGLTPPCTAALISAGIAEVFVASLDPNPFMQGKGVAALRAAGIRVHIGLCEEEARHLNRAFFHYITHKTPYLIGKWACSLDGQMSTHPHDTRTLSNPESLMDLHDLRHQTPAILIGARTAEIDNPSLTVRHYGEKVRHPQRIVLNSKANLSPDLKLFNGTLPNQTWLFCSEAVHASTSARFSAETTQIFTCPSFDHHLDLRTVLHILGQKEISSVLVEGGRTLLHSFFQQQLIQEVVSYHTPWIIAGIEQKQAVTQLSCTELGNNYKIQGLIKAKTARQ